MSRRERWGAPVRLGALQPGYLPWLGFFDQIERCDLFILYDDLPYTQRSWRNRNRIKTPQGWRWLTVPVVQEGLGQKTIREVRISEQGNWRHHHWKLIETNYSRAPFFAAYAEFWEKVYRRPWEFLVDLDLEIIYRLAHLLGIRTKLLLSSEEGLEQEYLRGPGAHGDPTTRIAFLCQRLGADRFLEGSKGREYTDPERLGGLGITLEFQDYQHPVYRQLFGPFIPYLAVIDLLFNHGRESLDILTGRKRRVALR